MQFDHVIFTIEGGLIGTFIMIAVSQIIKTVISFFIIVKFRIFFVRRYSPRFFLKV